MIHLRLRTEFSFRRVYGRPEHVVSVACGSGATAAAITDIGTWGHPAWVRACKARNVKPLLGTEIPVVLDASEKRTQANALCAFIARNNDGLRELYELVTQSQEQFFYVPRIDYKQLNAAMATGNVIALIGNGAMTDCLINRPTLYLQYTPGAAGWNRKISTMRAWNRVIAGDNLYAAPEDREAYIVLTHRNQEQRPSVMHIPSEDELRLAVPEADDDAFLNTERIAVDCNAELPKAKMIAPARPCSLHDMCIMGALKRGLINEEGSWIDSPADEPYETRLYRELAMIESKEFTDYFFVIADLCQRAKETMFLGPARGSSAGSLVCYLLGITDIDPMKHGLLFERFIDVTRADLPDIDIDFPDTTRDSAIELLRERYGTEQVGRIGTVLRFKEKSTLDAVGVALNIPAAELRDLKTLAEAEGIEAAMVSEIAAPLIEKYPALSLATALEEHASTSGKHAAGVVVADRPVREYCAIDRNGTAMIDKKDAEKQGLLKIDMLGLRTLSVLDDCLTSVGLERSWLFQLPLDDRDALDIFNTQRYAGIFQFEGYAVMRLCNDMKVREFDDLAAISALARPGPLHAGSAAEFVARRTGRAPVEYLHPSLEPITRDTQGVIVYQEQFMRVCREIGGMSWEDISYLRRGMQLKLGEDEFNKFYEKFATGANTIMTAVESRALWDRLITFGSYGFNLSHAIAYAYLSYWCAVLKSRYPLEFAAATLRNAKDDEQVINMMRELQRAGFKVVPFDRVRSTLHWSVQNGVLYGGLTNVIGVGEAKAKLIMDARAAGGTMKPGLAKALMTGTTPYDNVLVTEQRFASYYARPVEHNILSGRVSRIEQLTEPGEYIVIGRVVELQVKTAKRGVGKYCTARIEDDTGQVTVVIQRSDYLRLYPKLTASGEPTGKFMLWKGIIESMKFRTLMVSAVRLLD